MCKSSTNSSASAVVAKQSWADMQDDDDTWAPQAARDASKSSSITSTPTTASPKQSWADMSEDDISEGEILTVSQAKAKKSSNCAQPTLAQSSKDAKILSENCVQNQVFADVRGVLVEIVGMPPKLCSKMLLETIFEQVGVENHVCGQQIRKESGELVVAIKFNCKDAAVRCCKHFESSSWSKGTVKATVRESTLPATVTCESRDATHVGTPVFHQASVANWHTSGSSQQYQHGIAWRNNGSQWTSQWAHPWSTEQDMGGPWVHPYLTGAVDANPMPYEADLAAHESAIARARAYARGF